MQKVKTKFPTPNHAIYCYYPLNIWHVLIIYLIYVIQHNTCTGIRPYNKVFITCLVTIEDISSMLYKHYKDISIHKSSNFHLTINLVIKRTMNGFICFKIISHWWVLLCCGGVHGHISGCVYPFYSIALADRPRELKNGLIHRDNDDMRSVGEQYKTTLNCSKIICQLLYM